jgi:hypothetical protein
MISRVGKKKRGHMPGPPSQWTGTTVWLGKHPPSRDTRDAAELAAEDDRRWFDANPLRRERLREEIPGEFGKQLASDFPQLKGPNWRVVVVVVQVQRGSRMRIPFQALDAGHPSRPLDDDQMSYAEEQWQLNRGLLLEAAGLQR